jgi:threonine dehydratase
VIPTPLEEITLAGRRLLLKREDTHELGAFKWRGALPVLEAWKDESAETVVTASTGNHGAGTAWAAERLGLRSVVYAPESASRAKVDLLDDLGADVRLVGVDLDEAKDAGRAWADDQGLPFFEDGAERAQYEGYSAIGEEILQQAEETPSAVVVPVGNGALLGGVALAVCRDQPEVERVGVVAKEAPVMALAWESGEPAESDRCATFADGLAVRVAIPLAVDVLGEFASRMMQVSEREIARAVGTFAEAGIRAEGAAAAGLAAVPQLKDLADPLVLVVTGRNIDDELFKRAREEPDSFPD